MAKAIKPTVGRTLYYFESAKHAQDVEAGTDQPFIAFVTFVHGDSSINILAISHHNIPHPHLGVTLRQPGDDLPNGPHAAWMPYQQAQAAFADSAVAAAANAEATVLGDAVVVAQSPALPVVPAELIPAPLTSGVATNAPADQVESLAPAASAPASTDTTQPAAAAPEASAS